jgi:hypothetical protein
LCAPVKAIDPIGAKLFEIVYVGTVVPTAVLRHVVPWIIDDSLKDTLESFLGDVEAERCQLGIGLY